MILRDLLEPTPIPDDTYIYLGTQLGGGWLWICPKNELGEQANYFSREFHKAKQKELAQKSPVIEPWEQKINALETEVNELQAKFRRAKKKNDPLRKLIADKRGKLTEMEKQYKGLYGNLAERVLYLRDCLASWKDMLDRDVIELAPHTSETSGLGVIIEGDESGKYWLLKEVQAEDTKEVHIQNYAFTTKRFKTKSA